MSESDANGHAPRYSADDPPPVPQLDTEWRLVVHGTNGPVPFPAASQYEAEAMGRHWNHFDWEVQVGTWRRVGPRRRTTINIEPVAEPD